MTIKSKNPRQTKKELSSTAKKKANESLRHESNVYITEATENDQSPTFFKKTAEKSGLKKGKPQKVEPAKPKSSSNVIKTCQNQAFTGSLIEFTQEELAEAAILAKQVNGPNPKSAGYLYCPRPPKNLLDNLEKNPGVNICK